MPRVSVIVPTFNHGKFIAQTIEGILQQQTSFDVEVFIGDDASTDENPLVINEYKTKFPEKIKAFLHPKNMGPAEPKIMGGKNNVTFLFKKATSEYIALCEGDDYWADPHKLQKQVDFLDKNPGYALTHHQLDVIYEDGTPTHPFNIADQPHTTNLKDLLADKMWFLGTASTVFRNNIKGDFPNWWLETASGDLGIFILTAQHGKIKYMPETMGIYRKHLGGMTNIHTPQNIDFLTNRMEMFINLKKYFGGKYPRILTRTIEKYQRQLLNLCLIK
jgi:glycosyltransferase involved in cell wall biosynthesis